MGFFDRFKSQPRWKHADPAVRIAAVDAMPDEDQELLLQIAREDEDAGVRRAAVAKLSDPGALAAIARGERDESVRGVARDLVIALAQEATDEASARQARAGLWQDGSPMPPWEFRHGKAGRNASATQASGSAPQGAQACGAKRYCKQMTSCEEARFYLEGCGVRSLDGDGDGTPCEALCSGGAQ